MSHDSDFDKEERAAAQLLARLQESGGVAFVSTWGPSALAGPAARMLSVLAGSDDIAPVFAEWLMERVEVAELFVEDEQLAAMIDEEWSHEPSRGPATQARNQALEAALVANPDDEARYLVYGDWLQSRGDAYGELIAHQATSLGPAASMLDAAAADDFLASHAELLGPMAEYVGELIHLEWWMGFVRAARIGREEVAGSYEGAIMLRWVLEARACLVLRALSFESLASKYASQLDEMIAVLAERPPPCLHSLTIGRGNKASLASLVVALPELRELRVLNERVRLAPLRFARLQTLDLQLGWLDDTLAELADSELPALESLTLRGHGSADLELLGRVDFPALRHLHLQSRIERIDALPRARWLVQLDSLDLSGVGAGDGLVRDLLLPNLEHFRHLRELDLRENRLGESAIAAIESAFPPGVVIIGEQHPGGEDEDAEHDDDGEYYEDVME